MATVDVYLSVGKSLGLEEILVCFYSHFLGLYMAGFLTGADYRVSGVCLDEVAVCVLWEVENDTRDSFLVVAHLALLVDNCFHVIPARRHNCAQL